MSFNILKIDTSIRGHKDSFSSRMGEYAVKTIQKTFGNGNIEYLDLYKTPIPYLTSEWDEAAHTPLGLRSEAQNKMLDAVDMKPLIRNDIYICCLAGYMYDVPATFKSFLEHMVQFDVTVNANWSPRLQNKKALTIAAWGDDYDSVTPEIGYEFVVKKSFELLGIKEIKFFNIFNTNEITATEDTVQTQLEKEIISWK